MKKTIFIIAFVLIGKAYGASYWDVNSTSGTAKIPFTFTSTVTLSTPLGVTSGGSGQNWSAVTVGRIPYFSGTGTMTTLATGTTGHVLMSGGATAPVWTAPDVVNVKNPPYNAKGDGSTDDTSAIQSAINSGNHNIFIPEGTYKFSTLSIPDGFAVTLFGLNPATTILLSTMTTGDLLTVTAWYSEVRGITISAPIDSTKTSGVNLKLAGAWSFASNCIIQYGFVGVEMTGVGSRLLSSKVFNTVSSGSSIRVGGGDTSQTIDNCMLAYGSPDAGVVVYNSAALTISNTSVLEQGTSLRIAPTTGSNVTSLKVSNCFFDTATYGIAITPTGSGAVQRCQFVNSWTSSHDEHGVLIDTTGGGSVDGIDFVAHESHLNGENGVSILGANSINIRFLGGSFSANTGAGLFLGSGVSKVYATGLTSGEANGLGGNAAGIYLNGSNSDYNFIACDLSGNTTAVVGHTESLDSRIAECHGYDTPHLIPAETVGRNWGTLTAPTNGTTFIDNVLAIQNKSIGLTGETQISGNAAINFLDRDGTERCAFGYSRNGSLAPTAGYFADTLYTEIGNPFTTDANVTKYRLINTIAAGGPYWGGAAQSYFMMDADSSDGAITFKTPGSGSLGLDMTTTTARMREHGGADQFALATNISNLQSGSVLSQDDATKPSWMMSIGGGLDHFEILRATAGATALSGLTSLLHVSPTGIGIFDTTPDGALDIGANGNLYLSSDVNTAEDKNRISWRIEDGSEGAAIYAARTAVSNAPHSLNFATRGTDGGFSVKMTIDPPGNVFIPTTYSNTTASAANMFIDSDGSLKRSTSSRRYKTSIKKYTTGLNAVLKLSPVSFVGKNDKLNKRHAGLLAEDLDKIGLKEFVVYDKDGKPEAIEYSYMVSLLTNAIKELSARNDDLERRLIALEKSRDLDKNLKW